MTTSETTTNEGSRPNILIFMTDHEQADVSLPGHPCLMPNAARLAREGVRFRRAYCPTTHCCPSRATFMTGVYPSRHGVYNNVLNQSAIHTSLAPGTRTFSEPLREAGYSLLYTGKWHVSATEEPADRGWEQREVTAVRGTTHGMPLARWGELARQPESSGPRERSQVLRPGWGHYRTYGTRPDGGPKGYEDHPDYRVVSAAVEALPELAGRGQPWCLYVGPIGPHDPYVVPERFARMYDPERVPLPPSFGDALEDKPRVYQRMRRQVWDQLSEEEVREAIAHYWAYCTMEDALFGEVLDALEATGQAANTLVLRLSDHGDYAGAHGLFAKGVPAFREAYSIPCIARWPAGIARPGREVDEFVTLADVAPTLLEVSGAPAYAPLDGRSLAPFLRGEAPDDWPDACFSQFNGVELYYSQRIAQTKHHKYVYNGFDYDELYDLGRDPHELENVADRPEYREVKHDLVRRMWRFAERTGDELLLSAYVTVALAPWGPADGLRPT